MRKPPGTATTNMDVPPPPSAGDALVEAIADAVAVKLERMYGQRQRLLTVMAAAEYLGLNQDQIRERAGREFPSVRIDRWLRFDRRDLDRYIDRAKREDV